MKIARIVSGCLIALLLTSSMGFAETYQSVKITADKLNIREDMAIDATILGSLDQETVVGTSELTDGWYKISYSGKPAYISADYAEVVEDFSIGYITGQNVNVRDVPSTEESTVLSRLSDAEIQIHAKENDWYHITTADGVEGYVFADLVSLEDGNLSSNADAANLISIAKSKLGCPYAWAQEGPNSFDCSGFAKYCFKQAYGIDLPHSASAISQKGTRVSKSELQAGDLVFFATSGSGSVNHVGIYIGNGDFIHASSSSSNGHQVHINSVTTGYYSTAYKWAQRLSI
ncbi:MAG: C40 family peptidase [Clostridia bacterium]|nr:C40 family peptidase [Clostridia bacterium]